MTIPTKPRLQILGFGTLAYLGSAASLVACFWKATFGLIAPVVGLSVLDINPHLQAIIMWGFAAVTVAAGLIVRHDVPPNIHVRKFGDRRACRQGVNSAPWILAA
jgi:hypothetical protein